MTSQPTTQNPPSVLDQLVPAFMRPVLPYLALILAVCLAYANIYDNVFVFDDDLIIKMNDYLHDWKHIGELLTGSTTSGAHIEGGFYRPVQLLLFLVIYQLGGGSVLGYHLLNISLHAANTCLMHRLGIKLKFAPTGVFLASLIWGLHPLHTEAITYISGTADPLYLCFTLLGITYLIPDFSLRKCLMAVPLLILALLSKETAAIFPLLVTVCMIYVMPDRRDYRVYLRAWPLWVVTIGYSFWRMHAPHFDGPQSYEALNKLTTYAPLRMYIEHPIYRTYTFLATLPSYAVLLAWPEGLHMERNFPLYGQFVTLPVITGFAMLIFALLHVGVCALYPQSKPSRGAAMGWGILWFGAAHAPDSGILWPMNSLFLEHWMYVPTVGLFLAIAQTVSLFVRPRYAAVACSVTALVFATAMGIKTFAQNQIWHDVPSFYGNILLHNNSSARAHNNMGLYYGTHGNLSAAIDQYKQGVAIADIYPEIHYNLAVSMMMLPDAKEHRSEAIAHLRHTVTIAPSFYRAWQVLAALYTEDGNTQEAERCRTRAALYAPKI